MGDKELNGPAVVSAEDLARHERYKEAVENANAAVLPGPLREAFAGEEPTVCGRQLQPVTMGLLAILERLDSPLLKMARLYRRNADKTREEVLELADKELGNDPEGAVETVFCFLLPCPELRSLLRKHGREGFREYVMQDFGDKMHPLELTEMQGAVAEHFARSFDTSVSYQAKPKDGTVFTQPPEETAMVSAGGSIC